MLRFLCVAALFALFAGQVAAADQAQTLRDHALRLMGTAVFVPGVAAYCAKNVERNERLLSAAVDWNQRHDQVLRKIVAAIESAGGLSRSERDQINRAAFALVKAEVEGADEPKAYCNDAAKIIEAGQLDLAAIPDLQESLARVGAAP